MILYCSISEAWRYGDIVVLQLNINLTKSLGTGQICSYNVGHVCFRKICLKEQ